MIKIGQEKNNMVGYNQDRLTEKARELGYAGDMKDFPAFLEQNPMLAQS